MRIITTAWGLFLLIILNVQIASTCSVPIYQYALQNWTADTYQIMIFHDNQLNSAEQEAFDLLQNAVADSQINLSIKQLPASEFDTTQYLQKILFPWVALLYPENSRLPYPVWEGALTKENISKIIDSPVRKALFRRFKAGDAAVWLFLETGNAGKDAVFSKILSQNLNKLSKELKIPAVSVDSLGNQIAHPDSAQNSVKFSMISVAADAGSESLFRALILGTEPDFFLPDQTILDQPVAVPVFGRGRALYALVGNGINAKMIQRACESIIGWCSCEVKAENPGTDLLIKADWNKIDSRQQIRPEKLPPLTGFSRFIPPKKDSTKLVQLKKSHQMSADSTIKTKPDSVAKSELTESSQPESSESSSLLIPVLWLLLGGVVLVITTTIFLKRKTKSF